jgi:Chitin synthase export chaperone
MEISLFLALYLLTLPLQLITTGSLLAQGTTALVVFTAIHAGAVAAVFWALLANGIVSTQVVEDGTPSSLIVSMPFCLRVTSNLTYTHRRPSAIHVLLDMPLRHTYLCLD